MDKPILLRSALLVGLAMLNRDDTKDVLSHVKRYLINEDGEHLVAYGIMMWGLVVLVVCLVNWEWF